MKAEGYIEQVAIVYAGSNLAADHAINDTVLSVEDAVDFDEDGGVLLLNDVEYEYVSADIENNTVTLATGLTSAASDFDAVRLVPATTEKLATVSQGEGDSLTATVAHHLYGFIPDGVRVTGEKENVMLEEVDGVWYVVDILGLVPVFNGTFIDPTTLPAGGTDGLVPEYSPGPTVRGGYGSLYITYPAVPNNDPVTYDIHVSATQAFVPSSATLVASTPGTFGSVNALANGTALAADTTYYVQIVARDADGSAAPGQEASGQIVTGVNQTDLDTLRTDIDNTYAGTKTRVEDWTVTGSTTIDGGKIQADSVTAAQIAAGAIETDHMSANSIHGDRILANSLGADKIVANSITADRLAANAITSDLLIANDALINALQSTSITGVTITGSLIQSDNTPNTGLKIDNAGMTLYNPSGSPTTTLNSNGNSTFKGQVVADGLTVLDGMSLRGTDNEISQGAQLRMATATTESTNAPTVVVDWKGIRLMESDGTTPMISAVNSLFRQTDGKYIAALGGETNAFARFSSTGVFETYVQFNAYLPIKHVVQLGTDYYGIYRQNSKNYIARLGSTTVDIVEHADNSAYVPALGVQGPNLLSVTYESGAYRIRTLHPTTMLTTSSKDTNYMGLNQPLPVGIVHGAFDTGTTSYAIALSSGSTQKIKLFNASTGGEITAEAFDAPASGLAGIVWDGSKFITLAGNNTLYEHTGISTAGGTAWKAGFTWYNSVTGEFSAVSPYANFTMKRRARVTVTAPALPSTSDSIQVYIGYASGSAYRQGTSAVNSNSLSLTTMGSLTTGNIAPTVGTFSVTVPASIRSTNDELVISADGVIKLGAGGATQFNADGTAKVKGLIAYSDEDADTTSTNDPALITGDPAASHLRFDGDEIISMSTPSTQGTLFLNDGGITYTSRLIITSTTDANATASNLPPLRIGNITGNHLRIDGNEIISMSSDSAVGPMWLNKDGGGVYVGKNSTPFQGVAFGEGYYTTNASGVSQYIDHNLGVTPAFIVVQGASHFGSPTVFLIYDSGTQSFRFNAFVAATGAAVTNGRTVKWAAFA